MEFINFYDITKYLNETDRNIFTERECVENAYDYWLEYNESLLSKKPSYTMCVLCTLLTEDMDYMDYADLNNVLDIETMEKILKETIDNI